MNRAEARQLDCEIREQLAEYSKNQKLDVVFGETIMDQYLEIIPDDSKRDMISLGEKSASYKLGNARLNLKSVLLAAADFVVSLSQPESIFQYVQLAIISALCISAAVKKELDYNCAVIVYALHQLDVYERGVNTDQLKCKIKDMMECGHAEDFAMERLERNINELLKWNMIRMEEERIFLNETVWGKIK